MESVSPPVSPPTYPGPPVPLEPEAPLDFSIRKRSTSPVQPPPYKYSNPLRQHEPPLSRSSQSPPPSCCTTWSALPPPTWSTSQLSTWSTSPLPPFFRLRIHLVCHRVPTLPLPPPHLLLLHLGRHRFLPAPLPPHPPRHHMAYQGSNPTLPTSPPGAP